MIPARHVLIAFVVLPAGLVLAAQDRAGSRDDCDVRALYRNSEALWTDEAGRPTPIAFDALALIDDAPADGLDPADYGAQSLRDVANALATVAQPVIARAAVFDRSLSHAMVHLFLDLHRGRIDPAAAGFGLTRRDGVEVVPALRVAIERRELGTLARDLAPSEPAYAALRSSLPAYRNVGDDAAVRQIELSLERLRWLPRVPDGPFVLVNIPAFKLWAWDNGATTGAPALSMRVIVGTRARGRTPVLASTIESVIVRPYWNVPDSITRGEILPRLARDPGYLEREGFQVVRGTAVVPATAEATAGLAGGSLRLRQQPGPRNALGLVKAVFPNTRSIFLHGTPAPQLFNRDSRALSHGCVRVEDEVALAEWLLGPSGWTRDRLLAATRAAGTESVVLLRGVPVVLFYATAFVEPGDGGVQFAPDIYGHDARLDRLLDQRSSQLKSRRTLEQRK